MEELRAEVVVVLGEEGAWHWFETPNPGLEGRSPQEVARTPEGQERLRSLVGALLAGAYL